MRRCPLGPVLLLAGLGACGGGSQTPVAPTAASTTGVTTASPLPAAPPGPCTIGFDGVGANGAPFTTFSECALAITATGASWRVSTTYGNPAPFVQFIVPGGSTVTGEVTLQSGDGAAFTLASVDIYSSTTKIPYEITGSLHGAVAFTVQDVQGNTFGRFATVGTHHPDGIDALHIRLTNPAAMCCTNPVGLDNIRIVR